MMAMLVLRVLGKDQRLVREDEHPPAAAAQTALPEPQRWMGSSPVREKPPRSTESRGMFNPSTITLGKRTAAPSSSSPEPRSPGRTELVDAAQVPDERPPVPQQHQVLLCGKGEWGVEHSPRSSGTPARDSATRGRSPRGAARHGKRARGTAGQDPGERETGPQGRGGTGGARRARAAPGAAGARPHSLSMSWMRLAVPGM